MRRSRIAAYVSSLLLAAGTRPHRGHGGAGVPTSGRRHRLCGPRRLLLLRGRSGQLRSAPAATASAARRPTPTSGRPPIHPRRFDFTACSGARTGDVLANQLGPLSASTGLVSHLHRRQRRRLRRRHDDLCAAVRQRLPLPDQHREGLRRLDAPRPARQGLLGDQRQGPQRPRRRPRLPPLLQARRHLPRPLRDQAEGDQRRRRLPRHRHRQARRRPRLHLRRRPHHLHRPRDLLRQRLAAQRRTCSTSASPTTRPRPASPAATCPCS